MHARFASRLAAFIGMHIGLYSNIAYKLGVIVTSFLSTIVAILYG